MANIKCEIRGEITIGQLKEITSIVEAYSSVKNQIDLINNNEVIRIWGDDYLCQDMREGYNVAINFRQRKGVIESMHITINCM